MGVTSCTVVTEDNYQRRILTELAEFNRIKGISFCKGSPAHIDRKSLLKVTFNSRYACLGTSAHLLHDFFVLQKLSTWYLYLFLLTFEVFGLGIETVPLLQI